MHLPLNSAQLSQILRQFKMKAAEWWNVKLMNIDKEIKRLKGGEI